MTDKTTEAANDTAISATEASGEANAPAEAPDTHADPEAALDASLSAQFDKLNPPDDGAEAKAEDATNEGEQESASEDADETDQPEEAEGEQSETTAIAVPASWSKEMHEHWATASPQLQEYVAQREADSSRKISEQGNEIARARPFVEVASKYQQNFDRHGVTFEEGMESLMNAQALLDQDPLKGIVAIAQTYKIDLPRIFGPAAQQMDPALRQLVEQNRALLAQVQNSQRDQFAQRRSKERAAEEQANGHIAQWLESNDRPYFDQVQDTMVVLIDQGKAKSLDDAYDMACHADPQIRAELAAAQKAAEEAEAQKKAREKQLADARAVKAARAKAGTNGGNRANVANISTGDMLDDDAMNARLNAILANAS